MNAHGRTDRLDAANEVFHGAYRGAQDGVRQQVPVLVVSPTELTLRRKDQRRLVPYSCPLFTRAKTAAHIAVALFALTADEGKGEQVRGGVAALIKHISAALEEAHGSVSGASDEVAALLERCLTFAQGAFERTVTEAARADFASDAGPRVLRITELATCEQIAGLHAAVDDIFGQLSDQEQAELQVVVVGDHQARTRSLGMQYFKRRFREGATDERVTYGENVDSEEEAVSLVAKRRLDQQIAHAFFGDEHRLQRDVLGDAAERCLEQLEL